MAGLPIGDLRVFVPAHDMELTAEFYEALGWQRGFDTPTLKLLHNNDHRFYLNNQFPDSYTRHFRMHITVENAQEWFDHVSAVVSADDRFSSVQIKPPEEQPYGAIVTYVYDTSGVLLDLCQWTNDQAAEWSRDRFSRLAQLRS